VISAGVDALTKEALVTMFFAKAKATTILLTIGALLAGVAVLARQETAPGRTGEAGTEEPASSARHLDDNAATPDQVAKNLDIAVGQLMRRIGETVAVLGGQPSPDRGTIAAHLRDELDRVESEVRRAQERLAGWSGPDPGHQRSARTGEDNFAGSLPTAISINRSPISFPTPGNSEKRGQQVPGALQPTLRAGAYVFTASPAGNRAIAYDPTNHEIKSIELNATGDHPLRITPVRGDHVGHVALRIQGSRITRLAVFDLEAGKWLPIDLHEPVNGDVNPRYTGHSGSAYDLGRHVYTFTAKTKTWDHRDITTFLDDFSDNNAAKASPAGKTSK
jgi:hypothetical protein